MFANVQLNQECRSILDDLPTITLKQNEKVIMVITPQFFNEGDYHEVGQYCRGRGILRAYDRRTEKFEGDPSGPLEVAVDKPWNISYG